MMFCDVVQFTQQNNMEKALKDLNQAYRWLVRLCQVFHLDIVCYFLVDSKPSRAVGSCPNVYRNGTTPTLFNVVIKL